MLITFQIILMIVVISGLLFLVGEPIVESKVHFSSVTIAAIIAMTITFFVS